MPSGLTPQEIAKWYDRLGETPEAAACADASARLAQAGQGDPERPVLAYLGGEVCLSAGQTASALKAFQAAASVAKEISGVGSQTAADHVSGLAAIALWRWLKILDDLDRPPGEAVERVLAEAARLQPIRAFEGMVRSGLLPALPLLEEDIARRLASVARKAGRPEANELLLAFMNIDSSGELSAAEQEQVAKMIADGVISRPRLDLFRYRRQLSLVQTKNRLDGVAAQLLRLWQDTNVPDLVRAEAAYEWGNYRRRSGDEAIKALSAAYELARETGPVAERALYRRAMVYNNLSNRRADLFFQDMRRLIERHPRSRMIDDALYQVGSEQLLGRDPDPQAAFETFKALRAITSSNHWADSAYFVPAMGHLVRGLPGDMDAADALLKDYLTRTPDGVFRYRCLFWRGRIADMRQDGAAARSFYEQLVKEAPFDYYGVRARMHLHQGAAAVTRSLPPRDAKAFAELRTLHQASVVPDGALIGNSPLLQRLRAAKASGLYRRLREQVDGLGQRYRNRLDNVALETLDEDGILPAVALLLSWRQDALRARDAHFSADSVLRLSAFLGDGLGDWPIAMLLLAVPANAPRSHLSALQQDPRYLATAYPGARDLGFLGEPLDAAAWPIEGALTLGKSLMYAVIRQESAFFPGAISGAGALGLFQIMPDTFKKVDASCRHGADPERPAAYLFDPKSNTEFWSCWVQAEFKPEDRDALALMLVKHHAGAGNLSNWVATWKGRPIESDLEMQVESLRFPKTQTFVRKVLADVAIAEAAGLFDTANAQGARR